jgi:hypothetical protein
MYRRTTGLGPPHRNTEIGLLRITGSVRTLYPHSKKCEASGGNIDGIRRLLASEPGPKGQSRRQPRNLRNGRHHALPLLLIRQR